MPYLVDVEAFHGPLDLLLYLIEMNQVDIYDIPVAAITDQYISYLEATSDFDLERLSDFLVMASYLLHLKTRMLLPGRVQAAEMEEAEEIDPREELVQRLLEYRKFKQAAEFLLERDQGQTPRIYYRESPELGGREELQADARSLWRAYRTILEDISLKDSNTFTLPGDDINVAEKMEEIESILSSHQTGVVFQDLFAGALSRREALALFLALLELIRLQRVKAVQAQGFAQIKIFAMDGSVNVNA